MGLSKTQKSSDSNSKHQMNKETINKERTGLPVEAVLELLEQERNYYEVLRGIVHAERKAVGSGQIDEMEQLLRNQEGQLSQALETSQKRKILEQVSAQQRTSNSSFEVQRSKNKVRQELEMLRLENSQNIQLTRRRLQEISLTLATLGAGESSPNYTAGGQSAGFASDEKRRTKTMLDRKA